VIPDGPSITNFEFPAEMACSRSDIGIYFHASSNKGYLYGRDALDASMRELNLKGILLGSNSNNFCSDLYTNFGMLEYIKYLFALKNFKVFVYMSGSDGFESPPIDALLAGCIVISSCTPGAKFIAKFTNRILLLPKINQVNLTKSIKDSLRNFTPISAIEFENILRAANSHSVAAGAQKSYLTYKITINKFIL